MKTILWRINIEIFFNRKLSEPYDNFTEVNCLHILILNIYGYYVRDVLLNKNITIFEKNNRKTHKLPQYTVKIIYVNLTESPGSPSYRQYYFICHILIANV